MRKRGKKKYNFTRVMQQVNAGVSNQAVRVWIGDGAAEQNSNQATPSPRPIGFQLSAPQALIDSVNNLRGQRAALRGWSIGQAS